MLYPRAAAFEPVALTLEPGGVTDYCTYHHGTQNRTTPPTVLQVREVLYVHLLPRKIGLTISLAS
jgi:hypothetical protein